MGKLKPHQIDATGVTDGHVITASSGVAGWAAPTGGGGGGTPEFVGAKAVRTSSFSTTNSAYVAVSFTAADTYDTDAIHDPSSNPSRFTIPSGMGGVWAFKIAAIFAVNATGVREVALHVNGTIISPEGNARIPSVGASETTRVVSSADLNLSAGNYVELFVRQSSGGSLDVTSASLSAHYLGAP